MASVREKRRPIFSGATGQWAAMAATLALGIFVGMSASSDVTGGPVDVHGDRLYAAGAVDEALDQQLASAGSQGAVRVGLTFRDQQGAICRTFETEAVSGLACRSDDAWSVRGMFAAGESSASEFRMASGGGTRLMDLVDSTMSGEPFDAAAEAEAKRRGWR